MRVSRKKCAENRERVLQAAARLFCEEGFDDISLVEVMKAAGLTHGGFYGHFSSKDDLEVEATAVALAKVATRWKQLVDRDAGDPLSGLVDHYLSPQDWAQRRKRCALTTLVADVARQGERVRTAFAAGLEPIIDVLANAVTDVCPNARRRKALSIMSELIGALILARAVTESALSEQVIDAVLSNLSQPGGHLKAAEGLPTIVGTQGRTTDGRGDTAHLAGKCFVASGALRLPPAKRHLPQNIADALRDAMGHRAKASRCLILAAGLQAKGSCFGPIFNAANDAVEQALSKTSLAELVRGVG